MFAPNWNGTGTDVIAGKKLKKSWLYDPYSQQIPGTAAAAEAGGFPSYDNDVIDRQIGVDSPFQGQSGIAGPVAAAPQAASPFSWPGTASPQMTNQELPGFPTPGGFNERFARQWAEATRKKRQRHIGF